VNGPKIHAQDQTVDFGLEPKDALIRFLLNGQEITASVTETNV